MRRGEAFGNSFGTPTAASEQRHRERQQPHPGLERRQPEHTERKSGTTKNSPAWSRNWKKNVISPPVSCLSRSSAGG